MDEWGGCLGLGKFSQVKDISVPEGSAVKFLSLPKELKNDPPVLAVLRELARMGFEVYFK
ncbi:MAG: hypothetical protein QF473_39355 [Planctomycetota bacterium]|nr:hypothetical protein [Planctomycetota bacterium]